MSSDQNHDTISSNAGSMVVIATTVVKAIGRQLPSSQREQGDEKLNEARDLVTSKIQPMVEESDRRFIKEKIT
jgi:hypothetical protein